MPEKELPDISPIDKQRLVDFLCRARTKKEIAKEFKLTIAQVEKLLSQPVEGFALLTRKNAFNETLYLLCEDVSHFGVQPRTWKYILQPDGQPYLTIFLPEAPWKKVVIAPIADVRFGSSEFDERRFLDYLQWIRKNDHVFTFLVGDILQLVPRGKEPLQHAILFRPLLASIAHKVLWAQQGDLEAKMERYTGTDPLEVLCKEFDIPYFKSPVYVDIWWKEELIRAKQPFTFFSIHLKSAAQTKGGKLNAAMKQLYFQEFTMFRVVGHLLDGMTRDIIREDTDPTTGKIIERTEWIIICPSFLDYFKTQESKKGYPPPAWGAIACRLYADGRYEASS